jgi:transcription elongation factor Elf1
MTIETESNEERELFERMKAKCSICGGTDCTHQVQFMSVSVDDYLKLMDELALARVLIRELGDRLSKLEKGKEPLTCPICNATAYPYPKCGCVYYKEKNNG